MRETGDFTAKLPKAKHDAPEWLAAIQALFLVAERGGDTMSCRIGIMRAFCRDKEPSQPAPRNNGQEIPAYTGISEAL